MGSRIKCYDIQDVYRKIPKKERIVDEKTFGSVVKAYFRNVTDALFQYSQVILPYSMGMLRCIIVDLTPYYDTKTNTVHGGMNRYPFFKNNVQNRYIKIVYYKCRKDYNPFRFFRFVQSKYMTLKKRELYEHNNANSLFIKKT